jgi:hypothetical protein
MMEARATTMSEIKSKEQTALHLNLTDCAGTRTGE